MLVLSRFAGAAQTAAHAVTVDPHDPAGSALALSRALQMPASEQVSRMRALRAIVAAFDADWWGRQMIREAMSSDTFTRTRAVVTGAPPKRFDDGARRHDPRAGASRPRRRREPRSSRVSSTACPRARGPYPPSLHPEFGGIDIYLFDQLQRGRFDQRRRVLDAGCGGGRNLRVLPSPRLRGLCG